MTEPDRPDETLSLPAGDPSVPGIPDPEQFTKTLVKERYTIIRLLGRGGMGEVFLCRDAVLDLIVAVKFPTHDLSGRFLDEARNASRLNHPNIARLYHFDYEPEGRPFIVMEYVEGQCLSEILKAGKLTVERALEIIDAVLAALEEAHRNGIIHRDIKPRNIMITPGGQVKVLDFGLAKRIRAAPDSGGDAESGYPGGGQHTIAGRAAGTVRYMAPEQARGEQDLDERCDVFAAGAVLFECLTGQPAFEKHDSGQSSQPVQERVVAPPSSLVPRNPSGIGHSCRESARQGAGGSLPGCGGDASRAAAA